jgi:hypothetical protein
MSGKGVRDNFQKGKGVRDNILAGIFPGVGNRAIA